MTQSRKKRTKAMDMQFNFVQIESARSTRTYFGNQGQPIWLTISPNIIHLTIIYTCAQYIYNFQVMQTMKVRVCVIPVRTLV